MALQFIVGIGAMYIRRRPRVRVDAPQSGGGQERGMRSGTVPTPLCVGLGAACDLAMQEMEVSDQKTCLFNPLPHKDDFEQDWERSPFERPVGKGVLPTMFSNH